MNNNKTEEKTEHPTEHHIQKSRKKGQTKYSRELNSFFILFVGLISLWLSKNLVIWNLRKLMSDSLSFNVDNLIDEKFFLLRIFVFLKEIFLSLMPFVFCIFLITLIPSILFSGIVFRFHALKIDFSKLNLLSGLKNIFSIQIFSNMLKVIVKIFLITIIAWWYLYTVFYKILILNFNRPILALFKGYNIIFICCIFVVLGLIPIVIFDVFWQEFTYYKRLKMSFQDIKDEHKEVEGNPHTKMRIRQQMKLILRQRMIADVHKADVIITNPLHYSVALKYDPEKMSAPKVIAKGLGEIALKIHNLGVKNNIAIISAPLLARSLYRYAEIGEYIPGPLYKAVAEVLVWVWNFRKWKKEGGIFPQQPKNIEVPSELHFKGKYTNNG